MSRTNYTVPETNYLINTLHNPVSVIYIVISYPWSSNTNYINTKIIHSLLVEISLSKTFVCGKYNKNVITKRSNVINFQIKLFVINALIFLSNMQYVLKKDKSD